MIRHPVITENFVGNDIVSLCDTKNIAGFSNTAYLKKFLTAKEFNRFTGLTPDTVILAALLWSYKECAYKIMLQKGFSDAFAPALYEVSEIKIFEEHKDGIKTAYTRVNYKNNLFFCRSLITGKYLHSIACTSLPEPDRIASYITELTPEQGNEVSHFTYQLLLADIAAHYGIDKNALQIHKDTKGCPLIFEKNKPLPLSFSVSHDGNFTSFAFIKK